MSLVYVVKFRVDRLKYERLQQESRAMGFAEIASYLRYKVLGPMLRMDCMIAENNNILKALAKKEGIDVARLLNRQLVKATK